MVSNFDTSAAQPRRRSLPKIKDFRIGDSDVAGQPAIHFLKTEGLAGPRTCLGLDPRSPSPSALTFLFPKTEATYVIAITANPKDKNRGWTIGSLRSGGPASGLSETAAGTSKSEQHTWLSSRTALGTALTVTYDGSRHQAGLAMYLNGRAIPTQGGGNQNVELSREISAWTIPLLLGRTLPAEPSLDCHSSIACSSESEARLLHDVAPHRGGDSTKSSAALTSSDRDALRTWYLVKEDKAFRSLLTGTQRTESTGEEDCSTWRRDAGHAGEAE